MRVDACLTNAATSLAAAATPLLDAEVLLAHVLGRSRTWLHTWPEHHLDESQLAAFQSLLHRRQQGEPVAYLVGEQEFWSLPIRVNTATLIPRPDSETLVQACLDRLTDGACQVADMGTGSGALALALAHERQQWQMVAVDASEAALAQARHNAERLQLTQIEWIHSDWFAQLEGRRFHAIVSNPPYLAEQDDHLDQLVCEPRSALVSGVDGLDAIRHLISHAPDHLHPHGWLLLEHGWDQAAKVAELMRARGFVGVGHERDLAGHQRVTLGQWHA